MQLMAKKVTPELARIRGIPPGIDLRSPSRHPDILGADDLVIKVEELREATSYRLPVSVKLGAGRVRDERPMTETPHNAATDRPLAPVPAE